MRIQRNRSIAVFGLLLSLVMGVSAVFGQVTNPGNGAGQVSKNETETYIHTSKLMGREMHYRVILPFQYKRQTAKRYPVIYLLHGLDGHYDNWTDKTKLEQYSFPYEYIIVTPEGGDGWYTDSASVPADKYESYIIRELIPEIDQTFRTVAKRNHRVIAGLSMGGYGALKLGLKYPHLFAVAGSFSGAMDSPIRGQNNKYLRPSIMSVFGPVESQTRKDNDIFRIVRELPAEKTKDLPFLYIACGTEDFLFQANRDFVDLLIKQKIPAEYRPRPGTHNWTFWDTEANQFLKFVQVVLKHGKKPVDARPWIDQK